jgi:thiol:disulfide interchange protein DsbA
MPITWGGIHQLHAALYYTIDSLKLDPSTHSAVFVTIHKEGNFLQNPKAIKDFLANFGIAPELTEQYLNSFSVKQKVNRGIKYAKQLKITAVPMMVVDGTYIIESKGSFADMLKVVDHVVELQRPNS